jgi:hypothetical protein
MSKFKNTKENYQPLPQLIKKINKLEYLRLLLTIIKIQKVKQVILNRTRQICQRQNAVDKLMHHV